jgi:Domain of unknown function (DUF6268)
MNRFVLRASLCFSLLCFSLLLLSAAAPAFAQREQLNIKYEIIGCRPISTATPTTLNGGSVSASTLYVVGGFQNQLDREGMMLLTNNLSYRLVQGRFPTLRTGDEYTMSNITVHQIAYDGTYLQTLSEKFQLAVNLKMGLFSDLQNVNLSHFRIEPTAFLDWFAADSWTLGLGISYGTSNFGRLITVPVLHVYHVGEGGQFLIDALLPSRADFWYYPSKQWDLGISIALNGSQFQLGAPPTIETDKPPEIIRQFHFSNATIGPNIRYNLFDKTYLSVEGGYTILRRFGFANANGRLDTDYVAQMLPAFNFNVNTYFFRFGVQIMY